MIGDGIFVHGCISPGCEGLVGIDDEPWCFKHSPNEGSSIKGYSAKRSSDRANALHLSSHKYISTACHHTLHTKCRMTCKFCESKCACLCHNREED